MADTDPWYILRSLAHRARLPAYLPLGVEGKIMGLLECEWMI